MSTAAATQNNLKDTLEEMRARVAARAPRWRWAALPAASVTSQPHAVQSHTIRPSARPAWHRPSPGESQ